MIRSTITSRTVLGVVLVLIPTSAAALPAQADSVSTTQPVLSPIPEGFWPPEQMVETLLRRWAAAAVKTYDLTPTQHRELETQLLERWPKFLNENRSDLQPLLNEYLQARIATESPSAQAVREWADRALPQFEKLRRFIAEGNEKFAARLTTRQREKFETDQAKLTTELETLQTRLQSWKRGEFQEQQWWDLTRSRRTDPQANAKERGGELEPANEFELEMAAWDRFVSAFIEQYRLDDGQRATAESILTEMKARASDHYRSRRVSIAAMEELIRHPRLGTTEAEIETELIKLYGPIDAMFRQLERRLLLIPTQAQKRRAQAEAGK